MFNLYLDICMLLY